METKEHKFDFKLPMHPARKVSDSGLPCELKMDGRDITGVTDLTVRAGTNGFTNVVIGFEASCAVEFAGELIANINGFTHDEQALTFAHIYQTAKSEIDEELTSEGAELDSEFMLQAQFVKRIIELTLERLS